MHELSPLETDQVKGGVYDGQCNVQLASYAVATASIVVVSGPLGWAFFAVGWGLAAYGMQDCANSYHQYQIGYC